MAATNIQKEVKVELEDGDTAACTLNATPAAGNAGLAYWLRYSAPPMSEEQANLCRNFKVILGTILDRWDRNHPLFEHREEAYQWAELMIRTEEAEQFLRSAFENRGIKLVVDKVIYFVPVRGADWKAARQKNR